jgi:predicted kinase
MNTVIVLIGIPASGKSSFARSIVQSYSSPVKVVCPDLIRVELYADRCLSENQFQGDWQEIYNQIKVQFQQSYQAQKSVIYDATNCKIQYRQEIISLCKNIGFNLVTGIWLNVPLWICLQRNERRLHPVPESVILDMYRSLMTRSPSLDEGFDRLMIKEEGMLDDSLL